MQSPAKCPARTPAELSDSGQFSNKKPSAAERDFRSPAAFNRNMAARDTRLTAAELLHRCEMIASAERSYRQREGEDAPLPEPLEYLAKEKLALGAPEFPWPERVGIRLARECVKVVLFLATAAAMVAVLYVLVTL